MEGILNAIRSIFNRRKKEEELQIPQVTPTVIQPINLSVPKTPAPDFSSIQSSQPSATMNQGVNLSSMFGNIQKSDPYQYVKNRYVEPIVEGVKTFTEPVAPGIPFPKFAAKASPIGQLVMTAQGKNAPLETAKDLLKIGAGAASLMPDVFGDVTMPIIDYAKGASVARKEGRDVVRGGIKSTTLEEYKGLGDVMFNENQPGRRAIGNLAEIPLTILAGTIKPKTAGRIFVKNADELATVLKRGLKLGITTPESPNIPWKEAEKLLEKVEVEPEVLKQLKRGSVVEGTGYVLKKQGDELIANFDTTFKEAVPNFGAQIKPATKKAGAAITPPVEVKKVEGISTPEIEVPKTGASLKPKRYVGSTAVGDAIRDIGAGAQSPDDMSRRIDQYVDKYIPYAGYQQLKELRAGLEREIVKLTGTGNNYKQTYALRIVMRDDPDAGPIIKTIENRIDQLDKLIGKTPKGQKPLAVFKTTDVDAQQLPDVREGGMIDAKKLILPEKYDVWARKNQVMVDALKNDILRMKPMDPIVIDAKRNVLEGAETLIAMRELGIKKVSTIIKEAQPVAPTAPVIPPELRYEGGRLQSRAEFEKADAQLRASLNAQGWRTKTQVKRAEEKARTKAVMNLEKEWADAWADRTIDPFGKAGYMFPIDKVNPKIWKDKNFLATVRLNRETAVRIIRETFGDDAATIFDSTVGKVYEGNDNAIRMVNEMGRRTEDYITRVLGLATTDERKLIRAWGEKKITLEELKGMTPKWKQVMEADTYFRSMYDDLLAQINSVITKYGYEPIPKRQDYYTHVPQVTGFLYSLGFNAFWDDISARNTIPPDIRALTPDFKPNKKFFTYGLPRQMNEAIDTIKDLEDPLVAFSSYLNAAAGQVYMTDAIHRLRTFKNVLDQYSYKTENPMFLENFREWLNKYTNVVAGKTTMSRGTEESIGRDALMSINSFRKQISRALTSGNVGPGLSNLASLVPVSARTTPKNFLAALWTASQDLLSGKLNASDVNGQYSNWMARRDKWTFDQQNFVNNWNKFVGQFFQGTDLYSSRVAVLAKYYDNIDKGMDPVAAMKDADMFASSVIGSRIKGEMPLYFESKGWESLLLMFQLEMNNALSIVKDVAAAGENIPAYLFRFSLASWLFNNAYEYFTGRRISPDPIDVAVTAGDELVSDDPIGERAGKVIGKVINYLPMASALTGGRIPLMAGLPKRVEDFIDDPLGSTAKALAIYGSPLGGSYQAYKTARGLQDYGTGYAETRDAKLKYPIAQTPINLIRATLFGNYAFPESKEYYDEGYSPMGTEDTIITRQLLSEDNKTGIRFYELKRAYQDAGNKDRTINLLKGEMEREMTRPGLTPNERAEIVRRYGTKINDLKRGILKDIAPHTTTEQQATVANALASAYGIPNSNLLKGTVALGPGANLSSLFSKGTGISTKKIKPKKVALKSLKPISFKVGGKNLRTPSGKTSKYARSIAPPVSKGIPMASAPRPNGIRLPNVRVNKNLSVVTS